MAVTAPVVMCALPWLGLWVLENPVCAEQLPRTGPRDPCRRSDPETLTEALPGSKPKAEFLMVSSSLCS